MAAPAFAGEQPSATAAVVKGRIKVADEVVEKVAFLAATEVPGVADMGGDLARAFESVRDRIGIGSRRGNQGISAQIQDRQVAVSLTIVVEYGHVVMEVATAVKTNVARSVSRMLGLRVTEVNVTVDDVRLPGEPNPTADLPETDPF
ncbi:MAG TPA: Asp23/Gls24 family envelope stress response protein [Nonomuraea sp.]|nr:Asp23/Gls24 family envelope stress response protein [Nonomuraea sp.]